MKVYGAVSGGGSNQQPNSNMSIASVSEAMSGVRVHIAAGANSENSNSGNPAIAEGTKVYLSDAGGGRDIKRVIENIGEHK